MTLESRRSHEQIGVQHERTAISQNKREHSTTYSTADSLTMHNTATIQPLHSGCQSNPYFWHAARLKQVRGGTRQEQLPGGGVRCSTHRAQTCVRPRPWYTNPLWWRGIPHYSRARVANNNCLLCDLLPIFVRRGHQCLWRVVVKL